MCRMLQLLRSSYYEWLKRAESSRSIEDKAILQMINPIFAEGRRTYGTRRIKAKLAQENIQLSRRRIARLMSQGNLVCRVKRKFKITTDSNHDKVIAPNLLGRKFNVSEANRYWVGDITYVRTEEGWLYLATVIDLYSRKVVG